MNTIEKIKQLIDSFFAGETTLEQEETLRNYFTTGNVPDDLKKYQPIFDYFTQQRENLENEGAGEETGLLPIKLTKRRHIAWCAVTGIAAGAALLLTIALFNNRQITKSQDTICEGTFVMIDGVCTDDPKLVSKYAIDAIDAILMPTNETVDELDGLIKTNTGVLNEHIHILEQLENNKIE
ncbi:MAG: hypothetical protein LBL90_07445 [Prevotellaceae bacterium]|jgi:hypothetical protein|nr:hypothetical protein [Prevotellaceae bacterium]